MLRREKKRWTLSVRNTDKSVGMQQMFRLEDLHRLGQMDPCSNWKPGPSEALSRCDCIALHCIAGKKRWYSVRADLSDHFLLQLSSCFVRLTRPDWGNSPLHTQHKAMLNYRRRDQSFRSLMKRHSLHPGCPINSSVKKKDTQTSPESAAKACWAQCWSLVIILFAFRNKREREEEMRKYRMLSGSLYREHRPEI